MAHRQEEKEARRKARQEQEEAEQKAAARKRAVGLIGGILLAIGAVVAIVVVLGSGGGDGGSGKAEAGELKEAAAAAGCEFRQATSEGRDHVDEELTADMYKTNPPTSGKHNPVAAQDGFYKPGNEPEIANWVHSLEHGRILFQFKEGTPEADITKLRNVANEELEGSAGYHTLVFQNNSDMPFQAAAVSWTRFVGCKAITPEALDVMRRFRATYTDQAPEFIP